MGRLISPGAPSIISFEPTTPISDVEGATRKFTILVDQSVDVNWYLNGIEIQFNESVSNAEYTNISAYAGTWIISATANNVNGAVSQNWTWTVLAESELPVHNINTGENFLTIQAAIDDASPGDEIHVDNGTYYENVVVDKQLILLGESNLNTLINGNGGENVVEVIANDVVIERFKMQNGSNGIYVTSSYNTFSGNTASNNTLIGNTASNNSITGILMDSSSNNILYHNNLVDNTNYNAYVSNANNQWDSGSEGNYWSDYTGNDSDGDGIGDIPYLIPGGRNVDLYPLMAPYTPSNGSQCTISINTDKSGYAPGDTMNVSLNISNPGDAIDVGIYIWVDLPSGGKFFVLKKSLITLPAGFEYSNPTFRSITLHSIASGNYAWHAVLYDPGKSEIISESIAPWTFTGTMGVNEEEIEKIFQDSVEIDLIN